jgi:predicted RNase H-like HicB family nuclease
MRFTLTECDDLMLTLKSFRLRKFKMSGAFPLFCACPPGFSTLASSLIHDVLKPVKEGNMFVLYREGYEIYGVGETPEEAMKDASEWLDDGIEEARGAEMIEQDGGVLGKLYVSMCTDRLASALKEEDRDLVFDWNEDGLLDIVEGLDVEE